MIYLDNNATTPVDPEVADAVFSSLRRDIGNPSSSHLPGRKTREVIENARHHVSALLGVDSSEIYFTSGGTESNNLALLGTALLHRKGHIITSVIEHPSILNTCRHLESLGFEVSYAPVDRDGRIITDEVKNLLKNSTILISVMHSNNETGVIQPVEEIGALAREKGVIFHVDAAQSIGKMNFMPEGSLVDMITIVSHKFYGPKGIGALYIRKGIRVLPLIFGGGHEGGIRPGTENVSGIVGMGKACEIARRDMKLRVSHTTHMRDLLYQLLHSLLPDMALNGHKVHRLPNTLNVRIPGVNGHDLIEKIGEQVAASTGSACHSGKQVPSAVLKGMGLSDTEALCSIRLSVGKDNTDEEIARASEIIAGSANHLRT